MYDLRLCADCDFFSAWLDAAVDVLPGATPIATQDGPRRKSQAASPRCLPCRNRGAPPRAPAHAMATGDPAPLLLRNSFIALNTSD